MSLGWRVVLTVSFTYLVTCSVGFSREVFATENLAPSIKVTSCSEIALPGNYLVGNLTNAPANTNCLTIHDTQDVHIDCEFHFIQGGAGNGVAVSLTNVKRFSITHCNLAGGTGADALIAVNSSDGILIANRVLSLYGIDFQSVQNTRVILNTIPGFEEIQSDGNTIRSNTATCDASKICPGVLESSWGSNNTFDNNQINGDGDPLIGVVGQGGGADDGISINDESGDVVSNNTIRNTWDCGIETSGNIVNLQIRSNSIENVDIGVGGWYWNSWKNVTVMDNSVNKATLLFDLYRAYGLRAQNWNGLGAAADVAVFFEDNVFTRNQFTNPLRPTESNSANIPVFQDMGYTGGLSAIPGERVPQPSDFEIRNNVFTQNNFGHILGPPYFSSPVMPGVVVDGGGNVCSSPGADYPLTCN